VVILAAPHTLKDGWFEQPLFGLSNLSRPGFLPVDVVMFILPLGVGILLILQRTLVVYFRLSLWVVDEIPPDQAMTQSVYVPAFLIVAWTRH